MASQKTIFITGATGFVGANLSQQLLLRGYNLCLLVRPNIDTSRLEKLRNFLTLDQNKDQLSSSIGKYEFFEGDITKKNMGLTTPTLNSLRSNVDEIWHCAASTTFNIKRKDEIQRVNIFGTQNVLEFAKKTQINRFHHISTAYVCGYRVGKIFENELYVGQTFKNLYEESKCRAEELVNQFKEVCKIKINIYRLGIVVGHSKTGEAIAFQGFYGVANALYRLREVLKRSMSHVKGKRALKDFKYNNGKFFLPIQIPCPAKVRLNLVTIDYVTRLLISISSNLKSNGMIFHITNPDPPYAKYLFKELFKYFGFEGITLVNEKDKIKKTTSIDVEKYLISRLTPYIPYTQVQHEFDIENVRYILPCEDEFCPKITPIVIKRLLDCAVKMQWKRQLG